MEREISIKIISDGTTAGTFVIDAETGQKIRGVCKLEIFCDAMKLRNHVNLFFEGVPIEYNGESKACCCKEIKKEKESVKHNSDWPSFEDYCNYIKQRDGLKIV